MSGSNALIRQIPFYLFIFLEGEKGNGKRDYWQGKIKK